MEPVKYPCICHFNFYYVSAWKHPGILDIFFPAALVLHLILIHFHNFCQLKTIIMKLSIKHYFSLRPLIALLVFVMLYSCKKTDLSTESLTPGAASLRSSPKPSAESADVAYQWYKFMTTLQQPVTPQPVVFVQNRAFAYIGIGLFESVQPGIKGGSSFAPKLYEMPAMPKPDNSKVYLWSASANAAMGSLVKMFLASLSLADRAAIDAKEAAIYNQLMLTTPADVMQRSQAFGRSIAAAIYEWSTTDNFVITTGTYTPLNAPWAWVPTPPALAPAVGDGLQNSRPLLRYSLNATAPPIPVPYSEDPNSDFYKATKEVYDIGGTTTATAANKATANWWADAGGAGTGVPAPYHILSIVTKVLESQDAGLWKAAEVYAKTGIGIKDGPIITFRAKYQYNLLRPITYIRRHIDATWLSHLPNPPYPDYTSGLVSNYGPVIQVLITEFGDIPVTDDTYAWRGLPARHFSSLSQLLTEAALSRVYAGIHYRFTQEVSIVMGIALGNEIAKIRVVGPEYQ